MSKPMPNSPVSLQRIERDPAFLDTYADQLRLSIGMGDVTLHLGIADDLGLGQVVLREKVAVRLPLHTVKILVAQLQALVETYESLVGNILTPKNLREQVEHIKASVRTGLEDELGLTLEKPRSR